MDANAASERGWPTVVDRGNGRPDRRAPATVSISVHTSEPWTVIAVAGEMDAQVAPLVADLVGISAAHVVYDLREVTFMDASGLGVLMDSQGKAARAGGCVRVVAPSIPVRRLLALTRTDRVFLTFESVADALATPVVAWRGRLT